MHASDPNHTSDPNHEATGDDPAPRIVDTTAARFEQDVVERSKRMPVVIDFWAAWCQPCRLLAPLLEELTRDYPGRFVLVRANTEELPQVAAQFQVQSIPAVFALVDGEVIDFFQGLLPKEQLRTWIERVLISGALAEARRVEPSQPAEAEQQYRTVLSDSPDHPEARIGLARVLLAQDRQDESRAVIEELESRGFLEPEAEKVKAALDLQVSGREDPDQLRSAVEADPDNLDLRLKLAESLAAQQAFEEALQLCLELVERDKEGVGEQARRVMIDIFRVLPDDSDITRTYRRKLSALLF